MIKEGTESEDGAQGNAKEKEQEVGGSRGGVPSQGKGLFFHGSEGSFSQAFDETHRTRRMFLRFKTLPVRKIIPNAVTMLGLCAGLTGFRLGLAGHFERGVLFVLLACIIDGLDGRVARLLQGTSRFGAELDSLADFVNFGVLPGLMLYLWSLKELGRLGWFVALIYVLSCGLRLARFNANLDEQPQKPWSYRYFIGVPAPAGAILAMFPMYISFVFPTFRSDMAGIQIGMSVYIIIIAFLMISTLPTLSFKKWPLRIRRSFSVPVVLVLAVLGALFFAYLWRMMILLCIFYIAFIPLSSYAYAKQLEYDEGRGVG